jgi:spermidine synthase
MALEIVGGRLLSPFFGGSVYVWGSIIFVFLTALSAGYYLGGIASDKMPSLSLLAGFIAVAGLLILFIPPMVAPLVKFAFAIGLGNYGTLFVAMLLFFLPSAGLGMVSPYIVKLGIKESSRLGNMVGKFYAISTVGSIVGTLATTFILIPWFGIRHIIIALGIILVILAATILLIHKRLPQSILVICLLVISLFGITAADSVSKENLQSGNLIYKKETAYNNIRVEDYNDRRYLLFNDTEQSVINKYKPNEHIWPYTELMDSAARHYRPDATDILVIGIGGGTVINSMLAQSNNLFIDAVDIDPVVIRVAYEYFGLPESPKLRATAGDGRVFLRDKKTRYDVIMVDAYNRSSIPSHLTTREFFSEMESALKPDGIVIFNIVSSIEGDYSLFFKSLLLTSQEVFPESRLFQAETDDPSDLDNLILIASRSELNSPDRLADRTEYMGNIDLSDSMVLTDDYAPVETLALKIMSDVTLD